MTTYSIQAPDGKTYRIEGPPGATDEQVKTEVVKQNPHLSGGRVAAAYAPSPEQSARWKELAAAREAGPSPEYSPLSPNPVENAAAGMGKTLSDRSLGVQQTVANLGGPGDVAALQQEAKERALRDKPLLSSAAGRIGNVAGDVGLGVVPFMAGMKGVSAATRLLPTLPRTAGEVAGTAGLGGTESLTKPDVEGRSNLARFGSGAAWTGGTDLALRGAGSALLPFRNISPAMAQDIPVMERAGMGLLAENRSDAGPTRFLTEALARGPGLGINANRLANQKILTRELSTATGTPIEEATAANMKAMRDRLEQQAQGFRAGPDVPIPFMPQDLKSVADAIANYSRMAGKSTEGKVEAASRAASQIVNSTGQQFWPTLPATTVMDLRRSAGRMAEGARDEAEAQAYRQVRGIYDQALKDTHADKGAAYEQWLKQYGAMKDFNKGLDTSKSVEINPQTYASKLDESRQLVPAPGSTDELAMAASRSMPRRADSRFMGAMGWGLMGAGPALGALADDGSGAVKGLSLSALLAAALATKGGGRFLTQSETSAKVRALIDALNSGAIQQD